MKRLLGLSDLLSSW